MYKSSPKMRFKRECKCPRHEQNKPKSGRFLTSRPIPSAIWCGTLRTMEGAVIDPVLDYDFRSGKATFASCRRQSWTMRKTRHQNQPGAGDARPRRSSFGRALYQAQDRRQSLIGEHIRDVQRIFRPVFNAIDVSGDGSEFDHLFKDGERFKVGTIDAEVIYTPGHTPACVSYNIGDAVFVGDTMFMPDYGTARADFPGGDAHALFRSIQLILALPPQTRLFMCHDYKAPGRDSMLGRRQ